jgi:hypothetical protein
MSTIDIIIAEMKEKQADLDQRLKNLEELRAQNQELQERVDHYQKMIKNCVSNFFEHQVYKVHEHSVYRHYAKVPANDDEFVHDDNGFVYRSNILTFGEDDEYFRFFIGYLDHEKKEFVSLPDVPYYDF